MQKIQVKEFLRAKDMNATVWFKDKDGNSYHRGRDGIVYNGSPNDKDSEELQVELEEIEDF